MMNRKQNQLIPVCVFASVVLCTQASAQEFTGVIDSKSSSATVDAAVVFGAEGTLIGDYDAKTNPEGTQTRPGFFGGSGNNPIDNSLSLAADTELDSNPGGGFVISADFDNLLVDLDGLSIDLLNGQASGTQFSLTLLYSTFNTVNPTFIYPGGIPFTLPISQTDGLTQVLLTQSGPGAGTLSPTEDSNVFDLDALVTASLLLDIDQSLGGKEGGQEGGEGTGFELPIVLPISGQVTINGDGSLGITLSAAPDRIEAEFPIEGLTLPPVPFDLPTLGSDSASVLLSSSPSAVTIDASLSIEINAIAQEDNCPADMNSDGELDFFDVSDFLDAFGAMDPVADFDDNGAFDFFDVSAFLDEFGAGCP